MLLPVSSQSKLGSESVIISIFLMMETKMTTMMWFEVALQERKLSRIIDYITGVVM